MSIGLSPPTEAKGIPDVLLTTRRVRIRKDMLKPDGTAIPWRDSWPILRDSLAKDRYSPVIGESVDESIDVRPYPKLYSRRWLDSAHARILAGDREIRETFKHCSTVFITLTASGYRFGQQYCPVDHYLNLDRSWKVPSDQIPSRDSDKCPIYKHLDKSLGKRGIEYDYVRIDGVHDGQKQIQSASNNQYYAHRHILLYVNSDITVDILKNVLHPIIDLHIQYSPSATSEQHEYSDAIRYDNNPSEGLKPIGKMDRERGLVSPCARDISSHLPDVAGGSDADRQLAGMMYALNKRSWSDSKGFRSAYRDRFEDRTGRVHPDRKESGNLLGWRAGDGGFIPIESSKEPEDIMTYAKEIPNYY